MTLKIKWIELLDGVNLDYLTKTAMEMNTSMCVLVFEREKIEKKLNERLEKQLKITEGIE